MRLQGLLPPTFQVFVRQKNMCHWQSFVSINKKLSCFKNSKCACFCCILPMSEKRYRRLMLTCFTTRPRRRQTGDSAHVLSSFACLGVISALFPPGNPAIRKNFFALPMQSSKEGKTCVVIRVLTPDKEEDDYFITYVQGETLLRFWIHWLRWIQRKEIYYDLIIQTHIQSFLTNITAISASSRILA